MLSEPLKWLKLNELIVSLLCLLFISFLSKNVGLADWPLFFSGIFQTFACLDIVSNFAEEEGRLLLFHFTHALGGTVEGSKKVGYSAHLGTSGT